MISDRNVAGLLRAMGLRCRGLGLHRPALSFGRSVPRLRRRLGIGAALLTVAILLAGCSGGNGGHASPAGGSGKDAAKLGSSPLVERSQAQFESDLAALKGRVVVVNFWASWCGPCKAEMPALQQASKQYAGKPVTFVGVDSSDVRNSARKLLADLNVTYPTVYDKTGLNGGIATSWSVASLPQTWFVARDGSRSGRIPRPLSVADLRSRIDQLLTAA
jgi:thiol-disulfide isomerase/thioredoxin